MTIVGPGGVGKTSVAVTAAARVAGSRETSARFVDLAVVDRADGLLPSIMASVGARRRGPRRRPERRGVGTQCPSRSPPRDRQLRAPDRCGRSADRGPPRSVPVTSRSRHEPHAAVDPRRVRPQRARRSTSEPGIDLFVTRAQMLDRDYVATDAERDAISVMVERLDGLPLAIELFAARVAALSAVEMVDRFDDEELLTTSWRSTSAARHRSLHDVVSWSYALLSDDEQRCLRRMSVFDGSVSADAVNASVPAGVGDDDRRTRHPFAGRRRTHSDRRAVQAAGDRPGLRRR